MRKVVGVRHETRSSDPGTAASPVSVRRPRLRARGTRQEAPGPGGQRPERDAGGAPAAEGPQPRRLLRRLDVADRRLRAVQRFARAIATTVDAGVLLDRVPGALLDAFPSAAAAGVEVTDAAAGWSPLRRSRARRRRGPARPQGVEPAASMLAPLVLEGRVQGSLCVRGDALDDTDRELLTVLADQTALSLQNARLHQECLEQRRLRQDLDRAARIQRSFLPRALPAVEGIEFAAEYTPAYSVGGDLYDVFPLAGGRIGVFVGDVSGKAVSAALVMARLSSELRTVADAEAAPADVLARLNGLLVARDDMDAGAFVTAVFLTFDPRGGRVTLANAGHPPPLLSHRGGRGVDRVDDGGGTALGLFAGSGFAQTEIALGAGDAMVLYTDGVMEARSPDGDAFGLERMTRSVGSAGSNPRDIAARLRRDLRAFVGPAPQSDDVTLLVFGGAPRASAASGW